MTRVLVVEDDRTIALGLEQHLRGAGYAVTLARTGGDALRTIRQTPPALLVLDLMLPDMDGLDVLGALRNAGDHTPVLVLTARDSEAHTLQGFRLGADDYVAKPFRAREVLARVAALLRRVAPTARALAAPCAGPQPLESGPGSLPVRLAFGDVTVDTLACRVWRGGRPVALRPKEYDLLLALLARRGGVVSRATLLREVWGYDPMVVSRTVETHILELRRKLEPEPGRPTYVVTVRTRGYQLNDVHATR